ncbi:MAG: hypothetical protein LH628_25560 [Microcoleus sp. CAN_BIN18]|nr:hypothetical protein [Microcoleus sp. CAN_BIN18]
MCRESISSARLGLSLLLLALGKKWGEICGCAWLMKVVSFLAGWGDRSAFTSEFTVYYGTRCGRSIFFIDICWNFDHYKHII